MKGSGDRGERRFGEVGLPYGEVGDEADGEYAGSGAVRTCVCRGTPWDWECEREEGDEGEEGKDAYCEAGERGEYGDE